MDVPFVRRDVVATQLMSSRDVVYGFLLAEVADGKVKQREDQRRKTEEKQKLRCSSDLKQSQM